MTVSWEFYFLRRIHFVGQYMLGIPMFANEICLVLHHSMETIDLELFTISHENVSTSQYWMAEVTKASRDSRNKQTNLCHLNFNILTSIKCMWQANNEFHLTDDFSSSLYVNWLLYCHSSKFNINNGIQFTQLAMYDALKPMKITNHARTHTHRILCECFKAVADASKIVYVVSGHNQVQHSPAIAMETWPYLHFMRLQQILLVFSVLFCRCVAPSIIHTHKYMAVCNSQSQWNHVSLMLESTYSWWFPLFFESILVKIH